MEANVMKKQTSIYFVIFLLFALAGTQALTLAQPASVAQRAVYRTYTNARYDYSIAYPAHLLTPQGEADNGDGQIFRSSDGLTEMRVYGSQDLGGGLAAAYSEAQEGKNVTYKTMKRNWFVVSGYNGEKIFYQKTMFKDGVLKTFTIEYNQSQKSIYDAALARIARSFMG